MDREAETGEAVSCAVSLDGVPLRPDGDGEAHWASSGTVSFHDADGTRLKTLSFGPEAGKTTALLAAEVAHVQKVRPDAGCRRRARQLDVSREAPARRAGGRFLSCTSRRSCRACGGGRLVRPRHFARRTASTRWAIRHLRDKATTKTATAVLEREVLPQAQVPPARASRPGTTAPASSANKVLVNQRMKRARWSVDGGQNVLTFRAMSGRFDAAWQAIPGGANDNLNAVAA